MTPHDPVVTTAPAPSRPAVAPGGYDLPGVREVTDGEVGRFWEDGWVHLPGLIDPALVGPLFDRARELMGGEGDGNEPRIGFDFETSPASQSFRSPSEIDEGYRRLACSTQLGRNAARLTGRDVDQRFFDDILLVKVPLSRRGDLGQALGWHQDKNPTDRPWVYFWIPLATVGPDQGVVRYLNGSQKLGPLWKGGLCVSIEEAYGLMPRLRSCATSEAMTLAPGDVIAHGSWVVHGTDANVGTESRWVYRASYFPADALYTGTPSETIGGRGIRPWETLDHDDFPVVYRSAPPGARGPS